MCWDLWGNTKAVVVMMLISVSHTGNTIGCVFPWADKAHGERVRNKDLLTALLYIHLLFHYLQCLGCDVTRSQCAGCVRATLEPHRESFVSSAVGISQTSFRGVVYYSIKRVRPTLRNRFCVTVQNWSFLDLNWWRIVSGSAGKTKYC